MNFLQKQQSLTIFIILSMATPVMGVQASLIQPSKLKTIIKACTATKARKACIAITAAYALHRGAQAFTRHRAIKALPTSHEKIIGQPKRVVTLFAHGLGGDRHHGHFYHEEYDIFMKDPRVALKDRLHVFDFQDSPALPKHRQRSSCLAQDADIAKLKREYDKLVAQEYQVDLHGVSRGASTIFNFLAIHQPKNVRCVVLESPFNDLESIVRNKLIGLKHIPLIGSMTSAAITPLITKLPVGLQNHSVYGLTPQSLAHRVPRDIPLLFISSKEDQLIPHTLTQKLVQARQKAGHTHCYSLVVNNGGHVNILSGQDGQQVVATIKRFVANPQANPL